MIDQDRVITVHGVQEDESVDSAIRPKRLKDYIGQEPLREQMEIFVRAALEREESLDHVLIFGIAALAIITGVAVNYNPDIFMPIFMPRLIMSYADL